jgi:KipI family sensor histidine kinase inhibitor
MASKGAYRSPRFLPAGESAAVIELGNAIDAGLNARVLALDRALLERPFPGYIEAIPSYRSLLVFFDPEKSRLDAIEDHVKSLGPRVDSKANLLSASRTPKEIPTVYDGADLDDVARIAGVDRDEVVRLHSEREYLVYMVGFTPGFAYMGTTHEKLRLPRRATPRTRVPAGSVGIATGQTGIYPSATPGGWNLLGRAEHRTLFDLARDPPSFFVPGDRVRFVPVDSLPELSPATARGGGASGEPVFEVEDGGLLTTVQDLGRYGYQRYGVPVAGAVDVEALRAANLLLGNDPGEAALECTVQGPTLRALRPVVAAVCGGDLGAVVERDDLGRFVVPPWSSFFLRPGNLLRFEGRKTGARSYVAFEGGIDVSEVLGSRSTYLTAGFGGLEGRALRAGDRLGARSAARAASPGKRWRQRPAGDPHASETEIRVVLGPQADYFSKAGLETLAAAIYTVEPSSDRMGYRLAGPALAPAGEKDFISDGMMLGGIQVPASGLPIVMLADRATMGGYPKIATVIGADLPRLAQLLPGDRLRFRPVSVEEARAAR